MQKIQSFDWLHFKFNFQIQNKLLCLPIFVAKRIYKTHELFCFLCFHSRRRFFWFHKDREITKNLFTLAESNFGEKKTFVHSLELWRNFIWQSRAGSIAPSCPLGYPIRTQNSLHTARSRSLPYNKGRY